MIYLDSRQRALLRGIQRRIKAYYQMYAPQGTEYLIYEALSASVVRFFIDMGSGRSVHLMFYNLMNDEPLNIPKPLSWGVFSVGNAIAYTSTVNESIAFFASGESIPVRNEVEIKGMIPPTFNQSGSVEIPPSIIDLFSTIKKNHHHFYIVAKDRQYLIMDKLIYEQDTATKSPAEYVHINKEILELVAGFGRVDYAIEEPNIMKLRAESGSESILFTTPVRSRGISPQTLNKMLNNVKKSNYEEVKLDLIALETALINAIDYITIYSQEGEVIYSSSKYKNTDIYSEGNLKAGFILPVEVARYLCKSKSNTVYLSSKKTYEDESLQVELSVLPIKIKTKKGGILYVSQRKGEKK